MASNTYQCDPDERALLKIIHQSQEEAIKNITDPSKLLTILVAGGSNSGKSSIVSKVFGKDVGVGLNGSSTTNGIRTYSSKAKRLLLIDTPGLEKKNNHQIMAQLSECKADVLWLVLNHSSAIEQEELDIAKAFPQIPTIVILNKVDTLIINKFKDSDVKDFDSNEDTLPNKLKSNRKLMNVRERLINWKLTTSANIKRILIMSLRNDLPTDQPVGVINLCETTWMNCDQVASVTFIQAQEIWQKDKFEISAGTIILAAGLAAAAGALPVAGADFVGIALVQCTMLGSLCKIWDLAGENVKVFMDVMTRNIAGAAFFSGLGFMCSSILKVFPVLGSAIGGSANACIAGTLTIILGSAATFCLKNIHNGHMKKSKKELEDEVKKYLDSDRFNIFLKQIKELATSPTKINQDELANLMNNA